MIKYVLALIGLCFISSLSSGQSITKYYDSNWVVVPKESAVYYTEFAKNNDVYNATSYWIKSGKLNCKSNYTDTNFTKGVGLLTRYYKSGKTQDSLYFDNDGNISTCDHFFENGVKEYHAFYDKNEKEIKGEKFDSSGKKIPGYFTFQKQAVFPGGLDAWVEYLTKNLRTNVPAKRKAPDGNYTVIVTFLVNKEGKISEVKAATDPGYGTAEEAVRVIKNGPDWIPAIQNGKKAIYRQKQMITFQVH